VNTNVVAVFVERRIKKEIIEEELMKTTCLSQKRLKKKFWHY
jgi:hypothetical protein